MKLKSMLIIATTTLFVAALAPTVEAAESAATPEKLSSEFSTPPMERRLRAWWFWTTPYVTSEGVAKDIAAMDRAGMGGALMMTIGASQGVPKGWFIRKVSSFWVFWVVGRVASGGLKNSPAFAPGVLHNRDG